MFHGKKHGKKGVKAFGSLDPNRTSRRFAWWACWRPPKSSRTWRLTNLGIGGQWASVPDVCLKHVAYFQNGNLKTTILWEIEDQASKIIGLWAFPSCSNQKCIEFPMIFHHCRARGSHAAGIRQGQGGIRDQLQSSTLLEASLQKVAICHGIFFWDEKILGMFIDFFLGLMVIKWELNGKFMGF